MVPPNGVCAAASGSTWMNWWSSVASANASIRAWSTVSQADTPTSWPTRARISSRRGMAIRHQKGSGARGWSEAARAPASCGRALDQRAQDRRPVARPACPGRAARIVVDEVVGRARRAGARQGAADELAAFLRGRPPSRPQSPTASIDLAEALAADREIDRDAPRLGLREIVDFALEQFGVGHDQLLAGQRAQPRGLEPDPLDRAGAAVVADRVALLERLVEQDRERREQVGEDALRGEADGDAADAEAGDERGDVHAEIVEDQDAGDREQGDADQHADDRHRVAERAARRSPRRPGGRSRRGSARGPRSRPAARRR